MYIPYAHVGEGEHTLLRQLLLFEMEKGVIFGGGLLSKAEPTTPLYSKST